MWKKSQRVTSSSDRFVLVFTVFIKLLFGSLDSAERRELHKKVIYTMIVTPGT